MGGVIDEYFGELTGYGLYGQNAYLTGKVYLPNAGITDESIEFNGNNKISEGEGQYVRMWAGAAPTEKDKAPFVVTQDGSLYASKGIFSGIIQATDSTFSGWLETAGILIDDNQATYSLSGGGTFKYEGYEKVYYTNVAPTINTFLLMEDYKDETEEVLKLKNKDFCRIFIFFNNLLNINHSILHK